MKSTGNLHSLENSLEVIFTVLHLCTPGDSVLDSFDRLENATFATCEHSCHNKPRCLFEWPRPYAIPEPLFEGVRGRGWMAQGYLSLAFMPVRYTLFTPRMHTGHAGRQAGEHVPRTHARTHASPYERMQEYEYV